MLRRWPEQQDVNRNYLKKLYNGTCGGDAHIVPRYNATADPRTNWLFCVQHHDEAPHTPDHMLFKRNEDENGTPYVAVVDFETDIGGEEARNLFLITA